MHPSNSEVLSGRPAQRQIAAQIDTRHNPSRDLRLDRANSEVVLIVDDVPDNLSVLHDALDESGYTVLVATHG